ncbi:MAG: sulfate transporter CysZ [Gammaproteobacteria bacterium]|nr:sulfate transporter CysZ [Gammaproteobacteria bacterium]
MSKNNPFSGANYLLRGASMLRQPGIRKFVIVPLLINITLFVGLTFLIYSWASDLLDAALASMPEWLQWLDWLVMPIVLGGMLLFTYFTFTIVANLISAPFNSYLAEAVTSMVSNKEPLETDWAEALASVGPTIKEEFQKITYAGIRAIPFLGLFFIPGVNFFASAAWLVYSSWILSLQYVDYPFANQKVAFRDQRLRMRERRWLGLGFGGAVMFSTMIPVVNLFVVPSAVVGATLLHLENFEGSD